MRFYFLIIILLLIGCDRRYAITDTTRYTYVNDSEHKLSFIAYFDDIDERFELDPEDKISFERSIENWSGPLGRSYFFSADSVLTIFDDTLAIDYNNGRTYGNPMIIENYELLDGETNPHIYLFEFTNEDYERALDRGRIIEPGEYD